MHERLIDHINGHEGVRWATFEEVADDFARRYPCQQTERPESVVASGAPQR